MTALPRIRRSTLDIGSAFEKHALQYCNHRLHMSLRRVGGAGDGGVDLRGHWWIPGDCHAGSSKLEVAGPDISTRRLTVVAQCKAERKALGPRAVRELEGVMAHLRGELRRGTGLTLGSRKGKEVVSDAEDIVALMLSQSGFSKNAMTHASRSHAPMLLLHLPGGQPLTLTESSEADTEPSDDESGEILVEGAWWNDALAQGVLGGKMLLRREILSGTTRDPVTGEVKVKARMGLWYDGHRLHRMGPDSMDDVPS